MLLKAQPLIDHLAKCSAFDASIVATPLPCHAEETLKKPRSRTLSTVGKAERKVGGQRMREDPKCQNLDQATSSYLSDSHQTLLDQGFLSLQP